jgi:hypothetical protein
LSERTRRRQPAGRPATGFAQVKELAMRRFVFGLWALLLMPGCGPTERGTPLGTTFERVARPMVWRVLPRTQADSLGLQPGDLIAAYNNILVESNDDLKAAQAAVPDSAGKVSMTVLRGEEELRLNVLPGPLGVLPDAGRFSASLAVAIEDILGLYGVEAEYDWLAALTAETFAFTANRDECPSAWPYGLAGEYLDGVEDTYGLSFRTVYAYGIGDSSVVADSTQSMLVGQIADALARNRIVLVRGGWPADVAGQWGVVVRYDPDDSLLYGFTLGYAEEQPLDGEILEVYEVRRADAAEPDPTELLRTTLVQALEMGQAYADSGWQSGLAAYDIWIGALDSVPFCPDCGEASQGCFDRLVWTLLSNKESVNRFLADMRDALPDESELLGEAISINTSIISKLNGIELSGVKVGTRESQEKLARVVAEIQLSESQLLLLYEELIGGL